MRILWLATALSVFVTTPAYAYIDPGTAMLALQGLIGAIAGAALFLRTRITAFVRLFFKSKPGSAPESSWEPGEKNDTTKYDRGR